jgi:putative nucleotidyltransferase with HDIG domain
MQAALMPLPPEGAPMKKRILFVDDDAPILNGLRVRLHRLRDKWDMEFVESGAQAIQALESSHCDVVVTDMRMPGMDGAELLSIVRDRWPDAVRIVLSGYAELQQVVRLVPYAHQYYSKPCEAGQLENLIDRCLRLHELLRLPTLRAVVGRVCKLPAMPQVYARLQSLLASDETSVRDVAELVASDAAIAAKVLQLVNSAFFRLARRITNIEQAVNHLGFGAIRNLVISAEVFSRWPGRDPKSVMSLDKLQSHVHTVAAAARSLAAGTPRADDALLAGLLHDIGYWILANECSDELAKALETAVALKIPLHEAETRVIGASHAQIGAYLLGIWGLPYPVIEAVAYHHTPQSVPQSEFEPLAIVCTAHALLPADDTEAFNAPVAADPKVDAQFLASVNAPFDWAEAVRRVAASELPNEA